MALVKGLPWDSAYGRALDVPDPAQGRWGHTEELLKVVAELIDMNARLFIQANQKPNSPAPKPFVKLRRPDDRDEPQGKRMATPQEMAAMFGRNARYTPA